MAHKAVDVALHEKGPILRLDRGAREVGGVEQVALGVERRLGRVEIFRLLVPERAAPEGDDPALQIMDRKEQAPAEAVIRPGAVLARDREAGGHEGLLGNLLRAHEAEERVPALRGIAEAEALGDLGVDAALLEVGARPLAGRPRELLLVEARREPDRSEQLVPARIAALAALVCQRDAGRPGERADGRGEREPILAHQEAERVAPNPAAEAVKDALARVDREGGRLLGMERAEALPAGARLPQVHEAADEVDDVGGGADVVEQRLRILGH